MEISNNQFEQNLIKTVALVGLVRFLIALFVNEPEVDGLPDLYLDIASCFVFGLTFILTSARVNSRWLLVCFYFPLIALLLISFYVHNGLASEAEINSFALVIIFCLTSQGRWPLIFTTIFLSGTFAVLYMVEPDNIANQGPPIYYSGTFTLLVISLAIIWLTYHAKKVFDGSHQALRSTKMRLISRSDELLTKHELLNLQYKNLNQLQAELEEKILERTDQLKAQKDAIQLYVRLTLVELMKPYEQTISHIRQLEAQNPDELTQLIRESGKKLELEVEKIKKRLAADDE